MEQTEKRKPFLDVLAGECRTLAERFRLSGEQSDMLREFVTKTALRSWRNGQNVGWLRAKEGKPDAGTAPA